MNDANKDKSSEIMDVKEPITYEEQVKRIASKGFVIEDPDSCKEFLKQANYYRLLAYYLPFKKKMELILKEYRLLGFNEFMNLMVSFGV